MLDYFGCSKNTVLQFTFMVNKTSFTDFNEAVLCLIALAVARKQFFWISTFISTFWVNFTSSNVLSVYYIEHFIYKNSNGFSFTTSFEPLELPDDRMLSVFTLNNSDFISSLEVIFD